MTARAPYNFIPLPEKVIPAQLTDGQFPKHNIYDSERETGYFEIHVETVTPLFIRGMLSEDEIGKDKEAKDSPDPFTINGQPVLPGSSLRGMIRNLFEIVTFSRIHLVSDANRIFFRAVAAKKDDPQGEAYRQILGSLNQEVHASEYVKAGYLAREGDNWFVRPAQTFGDKRPFALVPANPRKEKGDQRGIARQALNGVNGIEYLNSGDYEVKCFDVMYEMGSHNKASRVWSPKNGEKAIGTLVCTGNMAETQGTQQRDVTTERRYFVLLKKETTDQKLLIPEYVIEDYRHSLSPFQQGETDQSQLYFDGSHGFLREGRPVFYIEENGEVIRFGHNPNFRVAHLKTDENGDRRAKSPRDLVPEHAIDTSTWDFTDAVFGYVSQKPTKREPIAYAGRVAVTDARLVDGQDDVFYGEADYLRRRPGSPKPTTFQHYLEQPNGIDTEKRRLYHYGTSRAVIRGHKQYWRQNVDIDTLKAANTDGTKPNVETTFNPLKEKTAFRFRVYFENLTKIELGALALVLTLGGDENLYHSLGMGKPYGLGAVKLTLEQLTLIDRKHRYTTLFDEDGAWATGEYDATDFAYECIGDFTSFLGEHGIDFNEHPRINQLRAMLRLYKTDPELFSYMEIEGRNGNEYKDRPVLPSPSEVEARYEEKEGEIRHQRIELEKERVQREGLQIGDIIEGTAFDKSDDIWFSPQKVQLGGEYFYNLEGLINDYHDSLFEAQIPADRVISKKGRKFQARILKIGTGDPIELLCEQIQ